MFSFLAYGLLLTAINVAALLWLFIRSPQHRWPAGLTLVGQVAGRTLLVVDVFINRGRPFSTPWSSSC